MSSNLIGNILSQAESLNAQGIALSTAGNNLANVNNPDYAEEVANFITTFTGGASIGSITTTRSNLLDTQIANELMSQGSLNAQSDIANTIQSLLGEQVNTAADQSQSTGNSTSSSTTGLYADLDAFFNAASALAASPTSDADKQQLIASAQNVAGQLNYLSSSLSQMDGNVVTQINSQTSSAQGLLTQIAGLNQQIARIEVAKPGSALALRDERQADIESLSKLMNINVQDSPKGLGQIEITAPTTGGSSVTLLDGPQVNGTLAYNSSTGTFTGGVPATALDMTGGSMAGYQAVRSGMISNLQSGLDTLSSNLVSAVNNVYNPGGTGNNFFASTGTTAATISTDPSLTSASLQAGSTGESGANDLALGIANLATTTQSGLGNSTFGDYYNGQVTTIGQQISTLSSQIDSTNLVYNSLVQQRQSESGVSTDQEMTNIMIYQRAYQANAHVISTMDTLLDTVVNNLGHF